MKASIQPGKEVQIDLDYLSSYNVVLFYIYLSTNLPPKQCVNRRIYTNIDFVGLLSLRSDKDYMTSGYFHTFIPQIQIPNSSRSKNEGPKLSLK